MLIPSSSEHSTRRSVAILIGINEYRNGVPKLRNAVRDVQTVAQVLREQHAYEVRLLLDEQATLAGLRTLLSQLPMEICADTRLILYFAGHGIADETNGEVSSPQGFLIPQDARQDDPATFLPMAEVQTLLAKLPCKHLLVLLDCCFAGAFRWSQTRSLRMRPSTLYRERYERYVRDSAWQVIASAASDERALDVVAGGKLGRRGSDESNSPFAAALCRGLGGAADLRVDGQPGDGVILANELHLYLESAFSQLEQQLQRVLQKPLLWSLEGKEKGQFIFFAPGRSMTLPSALELSEQNNPYRGLEPYEEKNAELFFGRKEVVEQLCKQVMAQPLTVVSGVSGSGKSSVVRAGLVSRLRATSDWHILPLIRPGNRPFAALAVMQRALGVPEQTDLSAAVVAWKMRTPEKKLLMVIDQLEELVTMDTAPAEQQEFLARIFNTLSVCNGYLHVVITLRSDFEPHFSELLMPQSGGPVRFLVRPMNRQELRQVIEGPAIERVLYFDPPTLVDQLVDEVAEMPGALPLLSFTMSELYRAYVRSGRSDRCLAQADYQRLNGVAGALSRRADEIFQSLDAVQQGTLRRVMLRMVAIEAGDVARRRVPIEEVRYGKDHPEEQRVERVLQRMLDARLVVSGRDSDGGPYVEPAHDRLVLGWPQLWSFIKQEQESIPLHRLLTQETMAWARKQRSDDHLWSSNPRLPLVLDLQRKDPDRFNALESEFIRNSQAAEQRMIERERRRQRELEESLAEAREQRRLAEEALVRAERAREHAEHQQQRADTEAFKLKQQLLSAYVEHGRQLLLEKESPIEAVLWLHRAQSGGSQERSLPYLLHSAMQSVDATKTVLAGHKDKVWSAKFSPDGLRIVTASWDNLALVWDADNGQPLAKLKGHTNKVWSAEFSPDGHRIVTASDDDTARVWDVNSGKDLAELRGHRSSVRSAKFSRDGRCIVTASDDKTARIWDANSGRLLAVLKGHGDRVWSADFSPDGRYIVTASLDDRARVWETASGRLQAELSGHGSIVRSAEFSSSGRLIVTASWDNTARVWETDGGRLLAELKGHGARVWSASFSPDGHRIVTASDDKTAKVWDSAGGGLLCELRGHSDRVRGAAFNPDGRLIVTSGWDHTARVWKADGGRLLIELKGHASRVRSAKFSPDSRHVVTASWDGTARVWAADGGPLLAELEGHRAIVRSAEPSSDGRCVVTASWDGTARVWATDRGKLLADLEGHTDIIWDAVFSPDGHRIVTASWDNTAKVWSPDGGKFLHELKGHTNKVRSAAFSPDSQRIVTASDDKTARIWEADSGKLLAVLSGHEDCVNRAKFSPDGRCIITASSDNTARVWESASGRLRAELKGHTDRVRGATYSSDGHLIATASWDNTARVWAADRGTLLAELKGHAGNVNRAEFSPDGRRIVTSSSDHTARVWDAASGHLLAELKGHRASVNRAEFSPDGWRIVTASLDNTARVWDAATGRLLAELKGHTASVNRAKFSPDGWRIITASFDNTARVWDLSPETRTAEQLAELIRCHVPAQFEREHSNVVVFRTLTPATILNMPEQSGHRNP